MLWVAVPGHHVFNSLQSSPPTGLVPFGSKTKTRHTVIRLKRTPHSPRLIPKLILAACAAPGPRTGEESREGGNLRKGFNHRSELRDAVGGIAGVRIEKRLGIGR
jgi:hypothetical protein